MTDALPPIELDEFFPHPPAAVWQPSPIHERWRRG